MQPASGATHPSDFDDPYMNTESIDMGELNASRNSAYSGVDESAAAERDPLHRDSESQHSRTALAPATSLPPYPPRQGGGGTATPIHPGASVQMTPEMGRSRANSPARYRAQNEKAGSYPRSQSHSRVSSRDRAGGYGNWQGPGGGHTPYGQIGTESRPGSPGGDSTWGEGDSAAQPMNKFGRFCLAVYNSTFLFRWAMYIIPLLVLLWIPGIVWLAGVHATVWDVELLFWSIWLTIVWCGWWAAALVAKCIPRVLQVTLGVVAPEMKHYIAYVRALQFYAGAALWSLVTWLSFLPVVKSRAETNAKGTVTSASTLAIITKFWFGVFLVLVILLCEKLIIQVVAYNFHKRSYEDRILEQKGYIKSITRLYQNSRDIGRSDTLDGGLARPGNKRNASSDVLKKALKGAKRVAQTATSVVGTVASEIAGEQLLQPNSPQSIVLVALSSASKSRQLARRLYYSFCPAYRSSLVLDDFIRCFRTREEAEAAFNLFDRDLNGDIDLEEMEMALLDLHTDRLALAKGMSCTDSAVGKLDGICMSLWWVIAALVIASVLSTSFETLITGAGTTILGLSWLIGTTAQEILLSIIFVFVKHPYDVGDRISMDGVDYIVLDIHLLSSVFKKFDGTITQGPHSIITTKVLNNYRRSGAIFENVTFDVAFDTPFEKIEALRARMLLFVETERRDYLPVCDFTVKDFAAQGLITLSTNINYKSNWANAAQKAQRRNKFMCAVKLAMSDLKLFGPGGAGDPAPAPADPTPYMEVPVSSRFGKHYLEDPKPAVAKTAEQRERDQHEQERGLPGRADAVTSHMVDDRAPVRQTLEDEADLEAWAEGRDTGLERR